MGRAVLILKMPRIRKGRAIILELEAVKRFQDMEKGCQEAMWQMEEKGIGRNCGRKAMRILWDMDCVFTRKSVL